MTPLDTTNNQLTCQACAIPNQMSKPKADKYKKNMTITVGTMYYLTHEEYDLLLLQKILGHFSMGTIKLRAPIVLIPNKHVANVNAQQSAKAVHTENSHQKSRQN